MCLLCKPTDEIKTNWKTKYEFGFPTKILGKGLPYKFMPKPTQLY